MFLNGKKVAFAPARIPTCQPLYPLIRLWGRVRKLKILTPLRPNLGNIDDEEARLFWNAWKAEEEARARSYENNENIDRLIDMPVDVTNPRIVDIGIWQ